MKHQYQEAERLTPVASISLPAPLDFADLWAPEATSERWVANVGDLFDASFPPDLTIQEVEEATEITAQWFLSRFPKGTQEDADVFAGRFLD